MKEIKKELKELEITKKDELEELERSLVFLAITNRLQGRRNNFREELGLREITRKKINKIDKLEKEIKEMKRLKQR